MNNAEDVEVSAVSAGPRARDRAALGRLYREHADFVWRTLVRLGVDEANAEDVAHEVFLIVGRRLEDFDTDGSFRAWLYGIARGVAANARRSAQRAKRRLEVVAPPEAPRTPEEQVQRRQAAAMVRAFLESLPDAQREAFVLVDIEGLSGPDAAVALGEKLNSVYSRVRLARTRFKAFAADFDRPRGASTPSLQEPA